MSRIIKKSLSEYSEYYRKYLIKIKTKEFLHPVYLVWLTDLQDNEEDKMIISPTGKLAGAYKAKKLINYIINSKIKLFDYRKTLNWAKKIQNLKLKEYALNDFDTFSSNKNLINKYTLIEIANFINLFTDLFTSTRIKYLEKLRNNKEIKKVWNYFYDEVFWPTYGNKKKIKLLIIQPYINNASLKFIVKKMKLEFIKHIELID